VSMLTQIAYQLVTLYFIARIGVAATAGVNAAANAVFIVAALTQVLAVSTGALVAQAAGRKDRPDANLVFNQALVLSFVCAIATTVLLAVLTRPYMQSVAPDAAAVAAGTTYIRWVLPGYALLLPLAVLTAALRGIGIVQPTMAIYMLTVLINALLAPILIAGWGTGRPMGVAGAGLATSLSILIGIAVLAAYFQYAERYLAITGKLLRPHLSHWRRLIRVGVPAGGELVLMFLFTSVVYYVIRDFGVSAQAGFGIGSRVLQTILLPGMSIALAAGPIVAQNFGAGNGARVRRTFHTAAIIGSAVMIATAAVVQWRPLTLVGMFDADSLSVDVAVVYLRLMSWTFVAQALIYACTSVFQGFGHTLPVFLSSSVRFAVFAPAALYLSGQAGYRLDHVWQLCLAAAVLQAIAAVWLVRLEFRRSLAPIRTAPSGVALTELRSQ
jgi:putative MATE family efflux protein